MYVLFNIVIVADDNRGSRILQKKYNCDISFTTDTKFEDSVWEKPKSPIEVTYNLDAMSCMVEFGVIHVDNKGLLDSTTKMYNTHGWKSPLDLYSGK